MKIVSSTPGLLFKGYLTIIVKMLKHKSRLTATFVLCTILFLAGASKLEAQLAGSVSASHQRMASRVQKRLGPSAKGVSAAEVASALAWQQALAKRSVSVIVSSDDGKIADRWNVSLQSNPQWMRASGLTGSDFRYTLDLSAIAGDLESHIRAIAPAPVDAAITSVDPLSEGVFRAHADTMARGGYILDFTAAAKQIGSALEKDGGEIQLRLLYQAPYVMNASDHALGELTLLATGHSDFEGSGEGRKNNVRKALGDSLNGVVVEPGVTFSFNSVLGKVTLSNGWSNALVIFNGGELAMAPGGGICQVATTLYRAVLHAGLPVKARANHSLFVHYYEKYGVGIDATVYPGKQDFTFTNDTPGPIFIQAYNDGTEAFVTIYGTPDNRQTVMEGPYFASTQPEGILEKGKKIRGNEIAWVRRVTRGGVEERSVIMSRYTAIPRSVPKQYPVASIKISQADL